MPFFGELYLRTTRPLQTPEVTRREVDYLARALEPVAPLGPVLDVGSGHGRHVAGLRARGLEVIGLELDPQSLSEREDDGPAIRADFRRLPLRPGALGAAY